MKNVSQISQAGITTQELRLKKYNLIIAKCYNIIIIVIKFVSVMRGITAVVQACGSTEAGRVTMSGAEMQMQSFRKSKRNRIIQLIHIENTKCCSGN